MSPNAEPSRPTTKILSYAARRRATKACIPCRTRKVRCDVTVKGTPCTNCHLDGKTCVVKDRASRRRLPRKEDMEHVFDSVYPPSTREEDGTGPTESVMVLGPELGKLDRSPDKSSEPDMFHAQDKSPDNTTSPDSDGDFHLNLNHMDCLAGSNLGGFADLEAISRSSIKSTVTATKPMVPYSSYPFLAINNIAVLSGQDLAFLEIKGCLDIPSRSALDEFVRQYFLHVHPFLPIIDEGEFWSIYNQDQPAGPDAQIPLILFQAMLFASCSFVPEVISKNLGYPQVRMARAAFYQKAKLLYDFSTETSPHMIARAALLLTMASPPELQPIQPNTMWLKIALHHARCVNAHLAWDAGSEAALSHSQQELCMLKRLWWCCLIRDRFLSLGLKRSIQVARPYPPLTLGDFQSEIDRSEVHSAVAKQRLVRLLLRVVELCNILTNVLLLIWPLDDDLRLNHPDTKSLPDCRTALRSWHKKTQMEVDLINRGSGIRSHSIIVHTNLMYMLYYAARAAIPHHEVLLSCYQSQDSAVKATDECHSREVQEAIVGTIECLNELLQLDLARYLPLSAMAFTTMPLLLNVLDAKLLSHTETGSEAAVKQRRLQVLIEAMKEYHPHYEGVEWIGYAVRHVVNLAQVDSSFLLGKLVSNWTDLLTHHPNYYLRLTLTIELSLSRSKIPDEHDVPEALRSILSPRIEYQEPKSIDSMSMGHSSQSPPEATTFQLTAEPFQEDMQDISRQDAMISMTSDDFDFDQGLLKTKLDFATKDTDLNFDDFISGSLDAGIEDTVEDPHLGPHSPDGVLDALCSIGLAGQENDLDLLVGGSRDSSMVASH